MHTLNSQSKVRYVHSIRCLVVSHVVTVQCSIEPLQYCRPTSIQPIVWLVVLRILKQPNSIWLSSRPEWIFHIVRQFGEFLLFGYLEMDTGTHYGKKMRLWRDFINHEIGSLNAHIAWWWHAKAAILFWDRCIRWAFANTQTESRHCVRCCGFRRITRWDGFESNIITIKLLSLFVSEMLGIKFFINW